MIPTHERHHSSTAAKDPEEFRLERLQDEIVRDVLEVLGNVATHVSTAVDEDIHPTEFLLDLVDHLVDGLGITELNLHGQ